METTQGIFQYSCLYLKLAKMPCFSYYLLCFPFYKIREKEGEADSTQSSGWEEVAQIMYLHISKCKNDKIK
jgi:hypothetical protein